MKKTLIHISDIHYKNNIQENQQKVLNAFFVDLKGQIADIDPCDIYVVISGDIVNSGSSYDDYTSAKQYFDQKLDALRISSENRICVPGNHDINRSEIENNKYEHNSVAQKTWKEVDFNNYASDKKPLLFSKFNNYNKFKSTFACIGIDNENPTVSRTQISENISIYSINSSILSCAGIDGYNDEHNLCINTRLLHDLIAEDKCPCKITVMHHHYSLFCSWCKEEFKSILQNDIQLCLSGHTHKQDIQSINFIPTNSIYIDSINPQLFSDKHDKLGYSIITIEDENIVEIKFRQWVEKFSKFVSGVDFSGTDNGSIDFSRIAVINSKSSDTQLSILKNRLDNAMKAYSDRENIWLNRRLSKSRESYVKLKHDPSNNVYISDIIQNPRNLFIQAPAEFGLTCLSHYIVKIAWKDYSSFWLRIDLKETRLKDIERVISSECDLFDKHLDEIKCIVIDSWIDQKQENIKIIEKLKNKFNGSCPIIIMRTIEPNQILGKDVSASLDNYKEVIHLLPLDRNDIRALGEYEDITEDEDSLVARITSDLDTLNMHRTPLNCFTILAASNIDHATIINRTTLIERVLQVIFDDEMMPAYMTKPDVKDCEYVLSIFCEELIRTSTYSFSKETFSASIRKTCESSLIDIDADCLFKILVDNSIIYCIGTIFKFRHSFWIYYFAARRMIDNKQFADFIFSSKKYIDFPEIIEFYTGIDRKREDALQVLVSDVEDSCKRVRDKMKTEISMVPYDSLKWNPNQKFIDQVKKDFSDDVQQSSLPNEIKDKYADSNYNPAKPFSQDVDSILSDYYVLILMRDIRAASMALRNSDYADGELKRELISKIITAWEQISQVIVAISPVLAADGSAGCGGAGFVLSGDFGDDFDEKIKKIILKIPENILNWFQHDIASMKLGPLFNNNIEGESSRFKKHLVALLIVHVRPNNWKDSLLSYIKSLHKNSYYLYDLFSALNIQYSYSYANTKELKDIAYLIKACIAKHDTGVELPGVSAVKKVPNDILPERNFE